jgi:hypothetical protein
MPPPPPLHRARYWCDGELRPTYRGVQGRWMNEHGAWRVLLAAHALTVVACSHQRWFVLQHPATSVAAAGAAADAAAAAAAAAAADATIAGAGTWAFNWTLFGKMANRLVLTCGMATSVVLTDWFHNLDLKHGGKFNSARNEIALLGWDMFMISCVMTAQCGIWVNNYYHGDNLQWWGSLYIAISCVFTCATGFTLAQMQVVRTLSDAEWAKVGAARRCDNRGQCILVHDHAAYRGAKHVISVHFILLWFVAYNTASWPALSVWLMHFIGFGACLVHQHFIMPHLSPGSLLGHFGGHEILHAFGFGAHATTLLLDMHTAVTGSSI